MEFLLTVAKAVAVMFGLAGLGMGFVLMILVIWVKKAAKGKAYAFFFESNRELTTELISVGVNGNPERFQAKDEAEYIVSPERMFWYNWPPGLPEWVKQPIPCSMYIRNKPDPLDHTAGPDSLVSAQSLKYMMDENMLRSTWKDASDSINDNKTLGRNNWVLYLSIATLCAMLVLGYLSWTTLNSLNEIITSLGL